MANLAGYFAFYLITLQKTVLNVRNEKNVIGAVR